MADQEREPTESEDNAQNTTHRQQQNWNFPNDYNSQQSASQNHESFYGQPFVFPEPRYRNAREYAQAVSCWLWQYRMFAAFCSFQSQMLPFIAQNATQSQTVNAARVAGARNVNGTATSFPANIGAGATAPAGVQYKIPMLWRRVVAEFLDFILLFYTKILVTVAVLRQMGYMNEDLLDIDGQFPFLPDIGELDYEKVFSLTSELIALEVVNRLCITLVETLCLRQGYAGSIGGATPGKKIMQLKVVSFTELRDLRHGQVLVIGAKDPGFFSALIRSIIKNFSMAFFFPACLTAFFFRFNRAAYDVLAQTVVVEVENRQQNVQQ